MWNDDEKLRPNLKFNILYWFQHEISKLFASSQFENIFLINLFVEILRTLETGAGGGWILRPYVGWGEATPSPSTMCVWPEVPPFLLDYDNLL